MTRSWREGLIGCLAGALAACSSSSSTSMASCDASAWQPVSLASTTGATGQLTGVWASGPRDVWAVGASGALVHWDGAVWSSVDAGAPGALNAVWGSGPRDVWAVGYEGALHWDGTTWSRSTRGEAWDPSYGTTVTGALLSVWGTGPGDVWAVGEHGIALHWDGGAWASVPSGTQASLGHVHGSGPNDVWATESLGTSGGVLHWDGTRWSSALATGVPLYAVWASGPRDAWAVGFQQGPKAFLTVMLLYHWDGTSWSAPVDGGGGMRVPRDLWGSAADDVWLVGDGGLMMHWDGAAWAHCVTSPYLSAVWGSATDVWAVGGATGASELGPHGVILHRS